MDFFEGRISPRIMCRHAPYVKQKLYKLINHFHSYAYI